MFACEPEGRGPNAAKALASAKALLPSKLCQRLSRGRTVLDEFWTRIESDEGFLASSLAVASALLQSGRDRIEIAVRASTTGLTVPISRELRVSFRDRRFRSTGS